MPSCKREFITPEIAKKYLAQNCNNRNIQPRRVMLLAEQMKNGTFQENGDTIRFNKAGNLIDGQHRLNAIVKSGVTIPMLVVRGLENSVNVIDRGKNRSVGDCLTMAGMDKTIATGLAIAIARQHLTHPLIDTKAQRYTSENEVGEFINRNEEEIRIIQPLLGKKGNGKKILQKGGIGIAFLYALKCGVKPEDLENFSEIVASGFYSSPKESAAIVLRNSLLTNEIPSRNGRDLHMSWSTQKAVFDFVNRNPRKRNYSDIQEGVFENKLIDAGTFEQI